MQTRQEIPTPALLLDLDAFESNLARMASHARRSGKGLRPHAKAHKCIQIARRQLAAGAIGERFSFEAAEADNKDGGPPRGGEFMLAIAPAILGGSDWEEHCEAFFERFNAIPGARLPGSRRHRNRLSAAPRNIDAALIERVRALCV